MDLLLDKSDQESSQHKTQIVTEFGEDKIAHVFGKIKK